MSWLGRLDKHDLLYGWLRDDVFPRIGLSHYDGPVDVYRLSSSNSVYLYKAFGSGSEFKVIGKFYGSESDSNERKRYLLRREYESLRQRPRACGSRLGEEQEVRPDLRPREGRRRAET